MFSEGLQAIQLEDGTTAYITHPSAESLFGDAQITNLDSSTLSLDQLATQVRQYLSYFGKRHLEMKKIFSYLLSVINLYKSNRQHCMPCVWTSLFYMYIEIL